MEDNLHEDKLDDYVRKSFEGYEENPAPNMWARIEGDLPIDAQSSLWRAFRQYRWQALAATVIFLLMSTLVCEHFYYQNKLRVLTEQQAPVILPEHREGVDNTGKITASPAISPEKETTKTNMATGHATTPQPGRTEKENNVAQAETLKPRWSLGGKLPESQLDLPTFGSPDAKTAAAFSEKLPPALLPADQKTLAEKTALPENRDENFETLTPQAIETSALVTPVSPLELVGKTLPAPGTFPVKPAKASGGWYIGLHATPLVSIEQTYTPRARPGRLAFANQKGSTDFSSIWWLRVGKENHRRPFSFETGIGYQTTQRSTTHTPRFRFGDGSMQGGGPGGQRTFNYDLSTYGGTAEVSLRMEQTSPGTPSDEESVPLQITTTANTELLRVPLLATANLGSGNLKARLKAGLLGNFFLKNEMDISARVSENARFRPVDGQAGYTLQLAAPGKFFLGYMASAGATWRIGKKIGIVTELSVLGDFRRNDASRRPLPKHHSIGINLGANYYF